MAPALYARYVPSKAIEKKSKPVQEEVQVVKTPTPTLYARYVPPKSANKATQVTGGDDHRVGLSQKRKREDATAKHVKRRKSDAETSSPNQHVSGSSSHGLATETRHNGLGEAGDEERQSVDVLSGNTDGQSVASVEIINSKRAKREKRSKSQEQQPADQENDDDSTAIKHAGVMSKYQKSIQAASERPVAEEDVEMADEAAQGELHDLVPIPVPKQPPAPEAFSASAALPSWLAEPVKLSKDLRVPFTELLDDELSKRLRKRGLDQALPVQAGVLPLLLPTTKQHPGDLCISAATGSGKTLSYVLPIVESLKRKPSGDLRAVIVVPTRELVAQVRETAELCTAGSGLRIGTAVGHHAFRNEQEAIVNRGQKYDPDGHRALREKAESLDELDELENEDEEDFYALLPFHVPEYTSNVDILICTPGRLVDHIKSTKGFSLKHLEWFVIDEADRLLDQSFQEWVDVIQGAMNPPDDTESEETSLLPAYLWRNIGLRPDGWVRKVVLSATMTRDLEKLGSLKLRNPQLVLVEGTQSDESSDTIQVNATGDFNLPSTLQEYAIPVSDGSEKPLFLLSLLQQILDGKDLSQRKYARSKTTVLEKRQAASDTSSDSSSSESDTDDSLSSDDEMSSSSEASSLDDEDDEDEDETDSSDDSKASSSSISRASTPTSSRPPNFTSPTPAPGAPQKSNALIFTSSAESAHRLSHLLSSLLPSVPNPTTLVATLTKSSTTASTASTLRSFLSPSQPLRILIATDRAARGLDLPTLQNVINYDVPHSVTSYVHRVGRTARAGRKGSAWTMVADREAAWFWNVVARGKGEGKVRKEMAREQRIQRGEGGSVKRVRMDIDGLGEDVRDKYAAALERLRGDVMGEVQGEGQRKRG